MEKAVSVSRIDRCPICGKADWCRFLPAGEEIPGARLVNCKRDTRYQDQVSSIDGRTYVFIKICKDQSGLYIDEETQKKERELWRQRHGYKKDTGDLKEKKQDVFLPVKELQREERIEGMCSPLPDNELDEIYRSFLSLLQLNTAHKNYLLGENWTEELIEKSMVRTLPSAGGFHTVKTEAGALALQSRRAVTDELVKRFGELKGVPGFYEKDGNWTFAGKQGLLFPLYNRRGEIYRLRIRVDYPDVDENGKARNKYHNFSSYREEKKKDGTLYNYYWNGTQANSQIGFYNLFTRDPYVVYITEGEKKALVANYILGQPVLCVPGVNSFGKLFEPDATGESIIEYATRQGARIYVIAYDADKTVNAKVLQCESSLVKRLKELGVQVALGSWNIGFGKGLDDILGIGIRPNLDIVM